MRSVPLHSYQREVVQRPLNAHTFLEGPAGTGKTTVGVERLLFLLEKNICADSLLVLVPLRTLANPYYQLLKAPDLPCGGTVSILTLNGLAQRMIRLFWPLIAEQVGFKPGEPPTFLTLETAQYYMAQLVQPSLDQGRFDKIRINPNRLYSQILDNLNKAAVVGFSHDEIGKRLKTAWIGESAQARVYDDAQTCAIRFREYCLANNLLDFSLQIEVFIRHLWSLPLCREYLGRTYRHLIFDNVEEDAPVTHDVLREWLPQFDSALLIYDCDAGYRAFLGADPKSAQELKALCSDKVAFAETLVASPGIQTLSEYMARAMNRPVTSHGKGKDRSQELIDCSKEIQAVLSYESHRFMPQMVDWVADEVNRLVCEGGISPSEIVVLVPFLSDSLRFALMTRFEQRGIPARSHRPSRALKDEPVVQCLLSLATIAHPQWQVCPTPFEIASTLVQAIDGMDRNRADLLARMLYSTKGNTPSLSGFAQVRPDMQDRITYQLGNSFERLRMWLDEYRNHPEQEFDHFLRRLFEALSHSGFRFHLDYGAGEVAANLIQSAHDFRWVAGLGLQAKGQPLGKAFLEMIESGIFAAQYVRSWQVPDDAVLLAPAHTFLMSNRPVDIQFWLDAGSRGWSERLYQPLTHPYVLSRWWPENQPWTDADETLQREENLYRLVLGLLRRCRRKIYLGLNELSEDGYENKGRLLSAFQHIFRDLAPEPDLLS